MTFVLAGDHVEMRVVSTPTHTAASGFGLLNRHSHGFRSCDFADEEWGGAIQVIGLDTNVLARYYIRDDGDSQALRQREAARQLMESGKPLTVCKTVLLELESVMRGYYEFFPRLRGQ